MAAVTQSSDASEPKPTLLIDVLPYADEYDELTQAEVEGLIEQEMRTFAPPNYLADAPEHVIKFQVRKGFDLLVMLVGINFRRCNDSGRIPSCINSGGDGRIFF
jgi:hypothetical protein